MRTARIVLLLGLCVCLYSCIDFHGQTMTYRYDKETDTALIFQLYEGIHATGDGAPEGVPTTKEQEELESVVKGQRTFLFNNWMTEYNRGDVEKQIKAARDELDKGADEKRARLTTRIEALELALKSVQVTNGALYLNKKGQLCGYQYVKIRGVSKLTAALNKYIGAEIETQWKGHLAGRDAERAQALIEKGDFVTLEGNQLRVRFPAPYKVFIQERSRLAKDRKPLNVVENDIFVNYDEPIVEIIIGRVGQKVTQLRRPVPDDAKSNLNDYVKDKYGLAPEPDIDKLREEFLQTGKVPAGKQ